MSKKSSRSILTDLLDQKLIANDGDVSLKDAMRLAMDNALGLDIQFVTLLYHQRVARYKGTKPAEFLREYVAAKFAAYEQGDRGARGDAVEAVTRYYLKRKFITYNDVMTASIEKNDVTSKRLGKVEVGHNGKTFQQAYVPADEDKNSFTAENYMNGDFQVVVYGAFKKDFTADTLLNEEKFLGTMRVFTNKYEFPQAIAGKHGLSSGWNIAHERATVQYNDSLRHRFDEYCAANQIPTLGEFLKK